MKNMIFNFRFDTITLLLLIGVIIAFVFLLADYKTFKRFIRKEKDRNIAFTTSQAAHYEDEENISEEFIEEFVKSSGKETES